MSEEIIMQPTEAMIQAGIDQMWEALPGTMDEMSYDMAEDEFNELISDTIVFIWQAMLAARNQ
ncbi:hypothetical protein P0E69_06720 [Chimaeribacter arupi]|uniref:hypothetical protein n=1 Tax=Chimaeribacter arupi TaxID=2060066 RepID=UPI002711EAB2|nr:hypothetical protein [Chimaeribacter arupi]WKZ93581.1 hypothetical protein P0E69_06720 [Chimaeribacter arupi]